VKNQKALIFFCRRPVAGRVKTRLAASLGGKLTARLYACFLKDLSAAARGSGAGVFLFHTPPAGDGVALKRLLKEDFKYLPQRGADLGARMLNAFISVFRAGFKKAVIIGSDTPDLRAADLRAAFRALAEKHAVIGPAYDGGYYLLGFNTPVPFAFADMEWSTSGVFQETLRRLEANGVTPHILPPLSDIDTMDDLANWPELLP